jgi:hypothetical protein
LRVDIGSSLPGRDVWMGYHRNLRQLRRVHALVDLTVERLAG